MQAGVWLCVQFAVSGEQFAVIHNTVARQPRNLTWFPFNAGNKTGNPYSDCKNLMIQR